MKGVRYMDTLSQVVVAIVGRQRDECENDVKEIGVGENLDRGRGSEILWTVGHNSYEAGCGDSLKTLNV